MLRRYAISLYLVLVLIVGGVAVGQDLPGASSDREKEPDYTKTWDPTNPDNARTFIEGGGSLTEITNPEHLNQYFSIIITANREGELGEQVNDLDEENIRQLTNAQALHHLTPDNFQHASITALRNADINAFTPEQRRAMSLTQTDALFNDITPENQALLNPDHVNQIATNAAGEEVTVDFGEDGVGGQITDSGFEFASVSSIQVGSTVLTQGRGIVFADNTLTVSSASTYIDGTTIATNVNNLNSDAVEFYVEEATQVQSDCITLTNVTDSTFRDGELLTFIPHTQTPTQLEDCTGNRATVQAADGAELIISKDAFQPVYILTNLTLDFTLPFPTGTFHENITSVGTTLANISRDWGLSKLIALSQVEYIYSGEQPLQYWKFRGTDAFTLHVRKDSSQARVTDCANCALLDLLAHEIRARGVVEVQKQPVNNDGTLFSDGFLPVLYQENFQAHTQLILDQNNERVVDQHILEDAPITTTHASTFLSLYEQTYRFFTERFVDINEQSGTHSDSVIAAYRTAYSNERTHIINNELTYEHNGCTTRVTPEGDALINAMLSWRAS